MSRNLLGVAGIANIGYPVSVGSDVDYVYTHEVGHTMNLYHAPCGGAGGPDPQYPYENGSIGVWGYDMAEGLLLDPAQYTDVMSYCFDHIWISDYQFDRAMTHRLNGDGGINHDAEAPPGLDRGEMLVVWGGVWEGRPLLEPAFVLEGPVVLPESDGPYRVEGLGANGETRFSLSFSPIPLDHGGSSSPARSVRTLRSPGASRQAGCGRTKFTAGGRLSSGCDASKRSAVALPLTRHVPQARTDRHPPRHQPPAVQISPPSWFSIDSSQLRNTGSSGAHRLVSYQLK